MPPFLGKRSPWFSFLVHPRSTEDLDHLDAARFLRTYSDSEEEFLTKAYSMPPLVAGQIHLGQSTTWGELVCVMRPPQSMMGVGARDHVHEAVAVAISRGTRVIGLGALTSPGTGGGQTLLPHLPKGVTVTNGNAYTAAVVRRNVLEAVECLGLGCDATIAVVGCTGSVGGAASQLLAEAGFRLLLVGRTAQRAQRLLPDLAGKAIFTGDLGVLSQADVTVLLTSDPSALLKPEMVQPGSVVIDCAQPANVSDIAAFERHGVRVVEGGVVCVPDYQCTYNFRFAQPRETFACLAETYVFAREGIQTHSVGRPDADMARRVERLADRRGIVPRSLGLERKAEHLDDMKLAV